MHDPNENRRGYKKTKVGWIPTRWDCEPFAALFTRVACPVKLAPMDEYIEIGIRSHAKGVFHKPAVIGKAIGEKRVFRCQPGTLAFNIVFAWEQAVGLLTEAERGLIASHRFPMFRGNPNVADERFYFSFFATERGKHVLGIASPGGAGRNKTLGQGELKHLFVPVPPYEEQLRINGILSEWDSAIASTGALIRQKMDSKRALSQRLLRGASRLPGFAAPWKTVSLGTLGAFRKGRGISRDDVTQEGVAAVLYGELYTKYRTTITSIASRIAPHTASKSEKVYHGEIVFAGSGETAEDIGKCAVIRVDEPCYAGGDTIIMKPNSDAHPDYIAYALSDDLARREVYRRAQGQSVVHLYTKDIREVEVRLPDRNEQESIATVLDTADREVAALETKLAALKRQKKGLMQKLLTGQVRVQS